MNPIDLRESSQAVRLWRETMSGSLVVKAIRSLTRPLWFLGRDIERHAAPVSDGGVVRVIEGSSIARMVAKLLARIDEDQRRSRAAHVVSALREYVLSLPPWQRIRATALMLFTAVAVHLLLTGFAEPTAMARAVRMGIGSVVVAVVVAVIVAVLVAVIAGAHHVAAAWVDWSSRRGAVHERE